MRHLCARSNRQRTKMTFQVIGNQEAETMMELMQEHPELSITQLRIWTLVERGLTSREIASLLGCSLRNIENHRYRIGKKIQG
jgi:DNA-binding CsgD family transcriptional regulator